MLIYLNFCFVLYWNRIHSAFIVMIHKLNLSNQVHLEQNSVGFHTNIIKHVQQLPFCFTKLQKESLLRLQDSPETWPIEISMTIIEIEIKFRLIARLYFAYNNSGVWKSLWEMLDAFTVFGRCVLFAIKARFKGPRRLTCSNLCSRGDAQKSLFVLWEAALLITLSTDLVKTDRNV